MVDVVERQLHAWFGACKRHTTVLSKVLTGAAILVLFGSAMFVKKHPGIIVYSVLVALMMSFIELLPLLARIDTRRQPAVKGLKKVMVMLNEFFSPLKKCLIYGLLGMILFLKLTFATYGGVMVLIAIPFIAAQYNDSPAPTEEEESPYRDLEDSSDSAPLDPAGVLALADDVITPRDVISDTVRACDLQVPAASPPFDTPSLEVVSEKEIPDQEWQEVDDNDMNLLLG